MDDINIQIEPCKTYFSDGCVETVGADETDLLRGAPTNTQSDEPVRITLAFLCYYCCFIHIVFVCTDYLAIAVSQAISDGWFQCVEHGRLSR